MRTKLTIGDILDYYLSSIEYIVLEDKLTEIHETFSINEITDKTRRLGIMGFKPRKNGIWFVLDTL